MPTEVRRLVFSNSEFYAALDQYLSRTGTSLPLGSIVQIRSDSANESVAIDIHNNSGSYIEAVNLSVRQVGGALISYCINNEIPLPRGFSKSLIISGDNIALEMTNSARTPLLGVDRAHTIGTIA